VKWFKKVTAQVPREIPLLDGGLAAAILILAEGSALVFAAKASSVLRDAAKRAAPQDEVHR